MSGVLCSFQRAWLAKVTPQGHAFMIMACRHESLCRYQSFRLVNVDPQEHVQCEHGEEAPGAAVAAVILGAGVLHQLLRAAEGA